MTDKPRLDAHYKRGQRASYPNKGVKRVEVILPVRTVEKLDQMTELGGFASRAETLTDLIGKPGRFARRFRPNH